jgi:hypothetical protein
MVTRLVIAVLCLALFGFGGAYAQEQRDQLGTKTADRKSTKPDPRCPGPACPDPIMHHKNGGTSEKKADDVRKGNDHKKGDKRQNDKASTRDEKK